MTAQKNCRASIRPAFFGVREQRRRQLPRSDFRCVSMITADIVREQSMKIYFAIVDNFCSSKVIRSWQDFALQHLISLNSLYFSRIRVSSRKRLLRNCDFEESRVSGCWTLIAESRNADRARDAYSIVRDQS